MQTRRAILPDAPRIHELISQYSDDGTLLPRTQQDIFENVRDFVVVEDKRRVVGCAALHFYGLSLAEVRSVAVDVEYHGRHAGTTLIKGLMAEAKYHKVERVFLFTRVPEFFGRMGFTVVPHDLLPEKVHKDCIVCPRRHCCDEIAMVHGPVPLHELTRRSTNRNLVTIQG